MKKFFNLGLLIIFCLGFIFPNFSYALKNEKASAIFSEEEINIIQDIIPVEYENLNISLKGNSVKNQNPFNKSTKEMMEGYSILPTSDSKNQIKDVTYNVNEFTFVFGQSIFVWIYLPDDPSANFYNLEISFLTQNNVSSVKWTFDYDKIYNLLSSDIMQKYGWKLFELSYNDAEFENQSEDTIFSKLKLNYSFNPELEGLDDYISVSSGKLSLYHMYLASNITNFSNVAIQLDYAYYKINQDFVSKFNALSLNDVFYVDGMNKIFTYAYAGRYNLLSEESQNKFSLQMYINNDNGKTDVYEGYEFKMDTLGTNDFSIKLYETRQNKQSTIIEFSLSINCEEYVFGNFSKNELSVNVEETKVISFKLNTNFKLDGNVTIKSSDTSILKVNSYIYDEESDTYFINITGVKKGSVKLIASADGSKLNGTEDSFVSNATINVSKPSSKLFTLKSFLILIGFYGTAFLIFGVITLINIKRSKKI